MSQKQITALIIIFLYMIATIAIGLIVSKMKSKKKASQSNEDFLMAGKSLGPLTLAGTLFAANTGGASTTGIATNVFQYGLSASWYVIAGGIGFILVSFIAPYFRRAAASTVPQIIGKRYGKPSHMVTAFTSIAALFMATGAQIIATASIINVVTGISFQTAAVITTAVVILYTMVGGFASVAAANMMHVLFITIGMAVAMFIMAENPAVGGFSALFAKAAAMKTATGADMNMLSMTKIGVPTVIGYIVMYCMTFPTAKIGSVLTGILSAVYAIVPAMIGLMAYTCIDGYAVSQQKNALADATMQFAPSIIAGIILAAVVAATMSSASGNMIGTATMFTNDVYRPYIRGGVHDDKKEILVSRVVMTIVGLVGLGVALTASNIISVMMSAFALRSAGPFAAFIGGLFCKNVTKDAGFLSILSGTAVAAYWTYALKSPFGLSAMVPGGIVAFAVLFIVSKYQISRGVEAAAPIELDKE